MQNNKANKKNSKKFQSKGKATKEVAFREIKAEKNTTINKFYLYGIIILFSFILYGTTISYDYALDDAIVITENKFTQKGIDGIKDIFSYDSFKGNNENLLNAVSGGRYRPLSIATFAVEYEFFGKNPHISHFINVLLYSLTCLLIFILFSKLLEKFPRQKWYSTIPFIATILFIAHPIHTEVVANIKSRDEIFSLLFSLLTFWFLWKYLDTKKIIHLLFSSFLFFLALISKEIAVVFIVIFPLSFYFFTNHSLKKTIFSLIPLFIIIIVFIILRQMIISKTGTSIVNTRDIMNNSFGAMNFSQKYATIAYTLGLYVKLLFYPHPLTWDYYPYHISIMEWSNFAVLFSLLIYLILLFFAFKGLKSKNFFSYCIFLYLIPLSLTSNIVFPVGAFMCERFLYAASLGFTLIIAYLMVVKPNNFFKIVFSMPYLFLVPVLFLYSFKTITRNQAWKNSAVLIETDVITSFKSAKSNASYGNDLYNKAEKCKDANEKAKFYELALQYCDNAFKINPNIQNVNFILGTIYGRYKNDLNKSIYYLNNAMNLDLNNFESYNNLGTAYGMAKQYDKAIETFERGLKISPENISIMSNLALTYQIVGKTDKAEEYLKKSKEIQGKQKK
ncbi:MAG: tetratricopeptide repeat protein [Bacteroidales bacterium]|nr:tetratricopeptide repeat protein [Bacteroidales bacterium]